MPVESHDPTALPALLDTKRASQVRAECPLAHFVLDDRASCSIWLGEATLPDGRMPGVIGHFEASDAESARTVLDAACTELKSLGRSIVVGPMDGNTWRRYRLITDAGIEPPFFLEPTNPPEYPKYFVHAGFAPIATYHSTIFDLQGLADPRTDQAIARFQSSGITIRPLRLDAFEADLASIHELSLAAFASNYLYSPLPREAFVAQYAKVRSLLQPGLALLAEAKGELLGFAFAIGNALDTTPGRTVIVKTVAVRPGRRSAGLGSVLIDLVRRRAKELGYTRAIHALMHDDNISRKIGAGQAKLLRRYALFAKQLG
ncbi:MAG: GNAT family N-acetyltransferase [Tepidisphaeraceae bacterium]